MPRLMFPYKTKDGQWSDTPEPREIPCAVSQQAKPVKEWVWRGFFLQKPVKPYQRQTRTNATRDWLFLLLYRGPLPAKEVYRQAAMCGVPARGVGRAKRFYKIKSIKRGGRQHGYGATWYWKLPKLKLP
jgi:hypothetical protein